MVAGIKEMLRGYEGTPAELDSESGRAPTPTPQEILELAKSFTPVEDIENITEAGNLFSKGEYGTGLLKTAEGGAPLLLGAIGTAMGTPAVGAAAYGGTKAAINTGKKILSKFTTSRSGSKYDFFDDGTTVGYRIPSNDYKSKVPYEQTRSQKTIFMNPKDARSMSGLFHSVYTATVMRPMFDKKGRFHGVELVFTEDYGPRKAGEIVMSAPAKLRPEVGLHPVEIYNSQSPLGSLGDVHFGSLIDKVIDITEKKKGGSVVEKNPYNSYKPKAI